MSANTEGLKRFSLFHILIIATLAIGLYSNTLKNGFVYDDVFTIVNNTLIKSFDNLPLLFDKTAYFGRSGEMSYRPVVTFTYFIDYALYGLKPWGYHLTNVFLHATNGALLYFFLTLLLTPHFSRFTSLPFLISLLFVSHPVLTEAVNCISYREDLLTFLFYIATLCLYLILRTKLVTNHRPLTTAFLYLLSCLTYLFALLSKEMAVTLPLIVFCYEWLYGKEKRLPSRLFNRYTMGYVVITIFYLYLRFYLFHNPEEQIKAWSLVERFLTLPWLISSYLKMSLFPVHLSADYVITPVNSPFLPIFILPVSALVSIFTIILLYSPFNKGKHKRFPPLAKGGEGGFENGFLRQRSILFGALFFLITLTPVYNLVPLFNPFMERYLYLPMAGFVMSAVYITYLSAEKLKIRPEYLNRYMSIFVLIVSIVFSFSVVKRNTIWRDDYSFWSDTVAKMPNSIKAHNSLGNTYLRQSMLDQAIKEYLAATRLGSNSADTYINLGVAYSRQGRYDQAIKEYLAAIRLRPDDVEAHYNLGIAYSGQGRHDEAMLEFTIALKLNPDLKEAYQKIKMLMEKKKGYKDAENATASKDKNWSP
ncbi:MAG: tetratricopeptide repeat protein [Deltaproteobacteria bacterium]|nr:tetratricopeptide repeat protein [Deltaproteobacteria bacterium]